jgi:hypothetical protein
MLRLSVKLHQLPPCPPAKLALAHSYDWGIERLSMQPYGHAMIDMLLRHVADFECQPTSFELVAMGLALVRTLAEVELVERHVREERSRQWNGPTKSGLIRRAP